MPVLFKVPSLTSGTLSLWLPKGRTQAERMEVSGLFMEKCGGLVLSDATIGMRGTIRLERCKKLQMYNLLNLLRSNS